MSQYLTLRNAEHVAAAAGVLAALAYVRRNGIRRAIGGIVSATVAAVPGAKAAVSATIEREVDDALATMFNESDASRTVPPVNSIPDEGVPRAEVLRRLAALGTLDPQPSGGQLFAYSYALGGSGGHGDDAAEPESHQELTTRAFAMYMHKNALNPTAFQSLRRLENEVVSMTGNMLHADMATARGTMTSGGTESILMAVKAYREMAREERGITQPNIVLPITAHPAFEKACHYFGVEARHSSYDLATCRASASACAALADGNTIAMVCSAPQYPHGAVDPVEDFAAEAKRLGLPLHVDACIGGFLLPFVERIGREVPLWDFRVPGVTSISLDVHKYGYAPKGSSVIIYSSEKYRKYQMFAYAGWPGGLFVSPSMMGSRNGGAIASAWASLVGMGMSGFEAHARTVMETADFYRERISAEPGMRVLGNPHMSIVSFVHDEVDIFAVGDVMEDRYGWNIERQQNPNCIHFSLMPVHATTCEKFMSDLREAVAAVRADPSLVKEGSAAMYGMVGKIPDDSIVEDFLTTFMCKVFSPAAAAGASN